MFCARSLSIEMGRSLLSNATFPPLNFPAVARTRNHDISDMFTSQVDAQRYC